jgi:isoquinoline 1-oxidoreductase beta subunit
MAEVEVAGQRAEAKGISRRKFMGYLIAAPTLVAAADLTAAESARAQIPTLQLTDAFDLADLLTDAALLTAGLLHVRINPDGTASFALPRAEVGQGITTAISMIIADELDLPLKKVKITLSDARPELIWNQLTGGSNTVHSLYNQVRVAAAVARGQLASTAAKQLAVPMPHLRIKNGVITAPNGSKLTYGSLTRAAAVARSRAVEAKLKPRSAQSIVGTPRRRIDARAAVTGKKKFAMDLHIPNALPTMLCRPPNINGTALAVLNKSDVLAMDGVTDVTIIPNTPYIAGGVAVRARTFGQCIDAVRALNVQWGPGTAEGKSDASVLQDLIANELPMTPALPLTQSLDQRFTFYFRPGDPLETNCAIADVRSGSATIWGCFKSPIWAQEQIALNLGMSVSDVKVHVTQGGGSFGRHLFADAGFEAAAVSKAIGKPVKLMWHRTDNFRQGRVHPMCTSRVRFTYLAGEVLTFDQRHTSVQTWQGQGLGEILSAAFGNVPLGADLLSQGYFELSASSPYNFGVTAQLLNEIYTPGVFNTSSVRNVYNPDVVTARELMVDRLAGAMGKDPYQFRRSFVRFPGQLAVLDKVAQVAGWGKAMAPGTAQGMAIHHEYKGYTACVVEIDCRPATVNRTVRDGFTGPRVTRVTFVVDVGLPINPLGLEAQMMGGIMDGIGQALTYSLHLQDGHFLEGSWDNAYYTRQWNVPPEVNIIVMPPSSDSPGGAGEFGVAASMAAVANAYGRATGTMPTSFPINHNQPLGFTPYPTVPPIPQSPTHDLTETL